MRIIFALTCLLLSLTSCVSAAGQEQMFFVTGVAEGNSGWLIAAGASNATAVKNPAITSANPGSVIFTLPTAFPSHPFAFTKSLTDVKYGEFAGEFQGCVNNSNVFTVANATAGPCQIAVNINPEATNEVFELYYICTNHPAMNGKITFTAPTGTPAPTTLPPTGGNSTTNPPTTRAPTVKPNSSASVVMPALTSIVLAAAAAAIIA